jgi:hypothetical protein
MLPISRISFRKIRISILSTAVIRTLAARSRPALQQMQCKSLITEFHPPFLSFLVNFKIPDADFWPMIAQPDSKAVPFQVTFQLGPPVEGAVIHTTIRRPRNMVFTLEGLKTSISKHNSVVGPTTNLGFPSERQPDRSIIESIAFDVPETEQLSSNLHIGFNIIFSSNNSGQSVKNLSS